MIIGVGCLYADKGSKTLINYCAAERKGQKYLLVFLLNCLEMKNWHGDRSGLLAKVLSAVRQFSLSIHLLLKRNISFEVEQKPLQKKGTPFYCESFSGGRKRGTLTVEGRREAG